MNSASKTPHRPPSSGIVHGVISDGGPTIPGSYEAFRALCAEFLRASDTANSDELEAGAKCVGLAYAGIQWDDENPFHKIHRAAGAPALMRIVTKKVIEREVVLAREEYEAEPMRCAP
ncbi:hypothetical protein LJR290_007681 [Variovorax sp. LjRoot290]|uniref:hypothetical protein n=1 Tax=Variovorax sp. LjRoot290 TaxID=3342316 RepID=UPI003ECC3ADF